MWTTRKWWWVAPAGLGVWIGASCGELPPLSKDVCGNGFVDANEDCDDHLDVDGKTDCNQPDKKCRCRQSDEVDACRWRCDDKLLCPGESNQGWGCGTDQVCRRPKLCEGKPCPVFSETASVSENASTLLIADLDGSGRQSVLSVASPLVSVHYLDSSGHLSKTNSIEAPDAFPAVGDLTSSDPKVADFAFIANGGVSVMRGSADQVLQPTVYAAKSIPFAALVLPFIELTDMSMQPSYNAAAPPFFLLRMNDDNDTVKDLWGPSPGVPTTMLTFAAGRRIAGEVVTERFFSTGPVMGGYPCAQYAVAFQGDKDVTVYSPCRPGGAMNVPGPGYLPPTSITLQGFTTHICTPTPEDKGCPVREALQVVDVDKDGKVDLVITAMTSPKEAGLFIAYNHGDGNFSSSADPIIVADNQAGPYDAPYVIALPPEPGQPPMDEAEKHVHAPAFAVGDLNEDCALDFVNEFGIYMSYLGITGTCAAPESFFSLASLEQDHAFTVARVADMTGDGHLDVVAGSLDDQGITFYKGTGTSLLNATRFAAGAFVKHFALGDFDGDSVLDLAFAQVNEADKSDALAVMFGNAGAPPSAPIFMGETSVIRQVLPTSVLGVSPDAIADLFVISERKEIDPETKMVKKVTEDVALFPGSTNRQLRAPYYLFGATGDRPDQLRRLVIGEFSSDGSSHRDIAALGGSCNPGLLPVCTNLWLLPSMNEAELTPSDKMNYSAITLENSNPIESEEVDSPLGFPIVSLNLGPTQGQSVDTDEVVLVAGGSPPSLHVVGVSGTSFAARMAIALGDLKGLGNPLTTMNPDLVKSADLRVIVADVDGDDARRPDVVVAAPNGVIVLWNRGNGLLDTNPPTFLPLTDLEASSCHQTMFRSCGIQGVAALNADADAAKELVIITTDGAYIADFNGQALILSGSPQIPKGISSAVAAGDVNGDGVDDIVVGQKGGIRVLLGQPAPPGKLIDADAGADAATGAR